MDTKGPVEWCLTPGNLIRLFGPVRAVVTCDDLCLGLGFPFLLEIIRLPSQGFPFRAGIWGLLLAGWGERLEIFSVGTHERVLHDTTRGYRADELDMRRATLDYIKATGLIV